VRIGTRRSIGIDWNENIDYIYAGHVHSHPNVVVFSIGSFGVDTAIKEFSMGDYMCYSHSNIHTNFAGYSIIDGKLMKFRRPLENDSMKLYTAAERAIKLDNDLERNRKTSMENVDKACELKQKARIVRDVVIGGELLGSMDIFEVNEIDFDKKEGWNKYWLVTRESVLWNYYSKHCEKLIKKILRKIQKRKKWTCRTDCEKKQWCDNINENHKELIRPMD
jgi:hypothetical protein